MQDTADSTPGPRQVAVLAHAKLIARAETEFEESRHNPRNARFTTQQIARTAVNEYATIARDGADGGRVQMARALATVAAHFAVKYSLGLEPEPPIRYVNAITDGDGITRQLSRAIRVF